MCHARKVCISIKKKISVLKHPHLFKSYLVFILVFLAILELPRIE